MTPERWRHTKAVLQHALGLAPPDRRAYLEAQPLDVAREVESLICAYESNGAFMETRDSGDHVAAAEAESNLIGSRFGPYRVLSLLGEGGMGSVWLAERIDGLFTRQVALKLVHRALMGRVMTERVAREREILASLSHRNIARLFDAGFAEDGQPYLALEFIAGTPVTTYCDSHRLPIRERLELFRQVLGAVQYAHAHLVIHRDLKPSNILVDEEGQVHLLDFGIAKLLIAGEAKETELTHLGGRALTPDYAAPEQISGAPITTAADGYALGVMLYELMTGVRPYRLKRSTRGALEEAILQFEPVAPSRVTVSEATAQARGTSAIKLSRSLKGDLDTIIGKALKKPPGDRYVTANAFDEDIARYLRGEVVLARRDSFAYRALKFGRRHRAAIAAAAVLLLTLAGGLAATIYEARVATAERDAGRQAHLRSLTQTAAARLKDADVPGAMGIILEVLPRPGADRPYTPEALGVFQEARAADTQVLAMSGHTDVVQMAAFSSDGRRIVTVSDDKTARVWDAVTGRQVALLDGHTGRVVCGAFSPDGRRLVTASLDKTARIWDAATGREIQRLTGHSAGVWSAAFSPDAERIVTASTDKTARIWDAATGREIQLLSGHTERVWSASFSQDGRRVVTASFDKTARIWDAATGRQTRLLAGHTDLVSRAAFSPDGGRIVTASFDKTARVWDAATGRQIVLLGGHSERVMSAAFSPDGAQIVTASFDRTARLWDAATGQQIMVLSGPKARMNFAAFSPDGARIVTASYDGIARLWDAGARRQTILLKGHTDRVWDAAFSPDGRRVITSSFDRSARLWDAATGRQVALLSGHTNLVATAAFSLDGMRVITASNDNTARVWDAATGQQVMLLKGPARVWCAVFSRDGQRIATASDDNTALVWDGATGRQLLLLKGHKGRVLSVAFSPDGRRLVTASLDKTARLWDAESGREIMQLSGHREGVNTAAFSNGGDRVVSASDDKTARIWDTATGREILQLSGHQDSVNSAAFSTDGSRVVTASLDRTARIWDAATGRELLLLSGHSEMLETAAFSADGGHVVTASDDRTARIWDAYSPPLDVQIEWAEAAQFDPLAEGERFQLGMPAPSGVRQWPGDRSECDAAAAAPYDPDRHAAGVMLGQIVSDTAIAACAVGKTGRAVYQHGRGLMASGDFTAAAREFETALARGYRSARVDQAMIRSQPSAGMLDIPAAVALYEQAWKDGVTIAAFELGHLYEHGVRRTDGEKDYLLAPDQSRAWYWYQRAAEAREPNALGRFAEKQEDAAMSEGNPEKRRSLLLESFKSYAAAAERARSEDWPDDAWRHWRYRRAGFARLLEREAMMPEVAAAYRNRGS